MNPEGWLWRLIRTYLVWEARHAWLLEGPIKRADRETASHDTTPLLFNTTTAVRALRSCYPSTLRRPRPLLALLIFPPLVDLCSSGTGPYRLPFLNTLFLLYRVLFWFLCSVRSRAMLVLFIRQKKSLRIFFSIFLSLFFKIDYRWRLCRSVTLHDTPSPSSRALLGVRRRRGLLLEPPG